jgi:hypothetical protein
MTLLTLIQNKHEKGSIVNIITFVVTGWGLQHYKLESHTI